MRQDELIQALARNGCGSNYQQEAAKRQQQSNPFGFLWQGDEESGPGGMRQQQPGALPFATYRTVCVRLCDGYYFPISYSTMQSHFRRDADACASKCAAPVELYYHQNPGAEMEQATSLSGQPYTKLPNAFRHRKEVVAGCSCKLAEYQPELHGGPKSNIPRKADASSSPVQRAPGLQTSQPTGALASGARTVPPDDADDIIARAIERSRRQAR
jgi:hypothetical protein